MKVYTLTGLTLGTFLLAWLSAYYVKLPLLTGASVAATMFYLIALIRQVRDEL